MTTALLRRGEPSEQSQVTILQKIIGNSQESFTGKSSENVDSYFKKFLITLSEEQGPIQGISCNQFQGISCYQFCWKTGENVDKICETSWEFTAQSSSEPIPG